MVLTDEGVMKRLFVANIPFETTRAELAEVFAQFGAVADVHILIDHSTGRSRGCGFVEYRMPEDAETAMLSADGAIFHGRTLVVKEAHGRLGRRVLA